MMRYCRPATGIAAIVLSGVGHRATVAVAQDAGRPLALRRGQAVDTALIRNPRLQVAIAQIHQARARVTEATAFPDPSLSAGITGLSSVTRLGSSTGSDIGLGLTIPFLSKFSLRGTR